MTHVRGRNTSSADRVREFRARHQVGRRVEVRSAFGGKSGHYKDMASRGIDMGRPFKRKSRRHRQNVEFDPKRTFAS